MSSESSSMLNMRDQQMCVLEGFGQLRCYQLDENTMPPVEYKVPGQIEYRQALKNGVMAIGTSGSSSSGKQGVHVFNLHTAKHRVIDAPKSHITVLVDISEGIVTVALNNDSSRLAAGGKRGSIFLFAADASGEFTLQRSWMGHSWITCTAIDFLHNGNIVSGGTDGFIKVWDSHTGAFVRDMKHSSGCNVNCLSASAIDDNAVISGHHSGVVLRWNMSTGTYTTIGIHPSHVHGIAISNDGSVAGSVSEDGSLLCYDMLTNEHKWSLQLDIVTFCTPAFYRDEIIVGGCNTVIRSYDVDTGVMRRQWPAVLNDPRCILVSDDSSRYAMVKAAVKSNQYDDDEEDEGTQQQYQPKNEQENVSKDSQSTQENNECVLL